MSPNPNSVPRKLFFVCLHFRNSGRFRAKWKQSGRPSGVYVDRNDILHVADHQSNAKNNLTWMNTIA